MNQQPRSDNRAYLLVYHGAGGDGPGGLRDVGNDPDFRYRPYTWGICRADVRRGTKPGDELFFVATRGTGVGLPDRYWLTGYLSVGETIDHFEAARGFPGRQNTLLEPLAMSGDPKGAALRYIAEHRDDLAWSNSKTVLPALDSGSLDATPFLVTHEGTTFIHSWWDPHEDWLNRSKQPYVIGDDRSVEVQPALSYVDVHRRVPGLLGPEELRTKVGFLHLHIKRRVDGQAGDLRQLITHSSPTG